MNAISPILAATLGELATTEATIDTLTEQLQAAKAHAKFLGEHLLAELLDEESLTNGALLPDGTAVRFEQKLNASIAASVREEAHHDIEAYGGGRLLRWDLTISWPKDSEMEASDMANVLHRWASAYPGTTVTLESKLPGPTLSAWVRERLRGGLPVPPSVTYYAPYRAVRLEA